MDAIVSMLYEELLQIEKESLRSLEERNKNNWLCPILKEEIADIRDALHKIENGNFGKCDISGGLIPYQLLALIPTIKTINEFKSLELFYRKPFHVHR